MTVETLLKRASIADVTTVQGSNAIWTSRCLESHQAGYAEMREDGTIDGVPVSMYYMLDEDDQASDDLADVDWAAALDRIEIDLCRCDQMGIDDAAITALVARLG
jgi:hypothetical protein